MVNFIERHCEVPMAPFNEDISLLSTTLLLSFSAIAYSFYILKTELSLLKETKQDIDSSGEIEETVYPSWSGSYADGEDSLLITIVRQKFCSKKKNDAWVSWDGADDASVVSRNYYLGNSDPSFDWNIQEREFDTKATAKETMTDGWDSLVHIKLTAFVNKSIQTSTDVNTFLKRLLEQNRIEWQKTLVELREYRDIFT